MKDVWKQRGGTCGWWKDGHQTRVFNWVEFVGSEYSGALTRIKIMQTGTGRWSAVRVMPAYNAKSRPSGFRHCDMNPRTVGVPPDVVSIV